MTVPLAALIAAYQDCEDAPGQLRATLPLAGRTLIERQARLARAAGARRLVVLVERVPPALLAALDRLRADGFAIAMARTAVEAGEAVDPHAPLLVIADGFLGEEEQVRRIAGAGGLALATLPDAAGDGRYERIDAASRWAGLALLDGALLRDTAAMLHDWDPQSTLLRRALQDGARQLPIEGGGFTIALAVRDLDTAEDRLIAESPGGRGGWVSRYVTGAIERAATRWLMPRRVSAGTVAIGALFLTGLGALSFARDIGWLGLVVLIVSLPLDGVADRLARLRMEAYGEESWTRLLTTALAAGALFALAFTQFDNGQGWGAIAVAASTVAFLLALRFEVAGRAVRGEILLAERKGMVLLLTPFALFDQWAAGLVALLVYAAGSFFWAQAEVHRRAAPPAED